MEVKVMICENLVHSPVSVLSCGQHGCLRVRRCSGSGSGSGFGSVCCSLTDMDSHSRKLREFPFVSAAQKRLMLDLVSTVENRLDSQLLPCSLPSDVRYYQSPSATSQASLHIRPGHPHSPIDFVLGSWVHSELPTGGSLDITTLSAYLNSSTDAPNFVFEIIRSSPTMLVLFLDLLPRKDLVLWSDYLKTFYEDTQLDVHRQTLEAVPEVQPYFSSSLYVRAAASPTVILVRILTENGGVERMEEIIRDHLDPISKQVLGIWLDHCACAKREVGEAERAYLRKRDGVVRNKTIEIDLGSSYPKMFGAEVANRVLESMKEYFTV
ncbi:hypothetical protein Fmac_030510 [Flemingia macrophylla]|uniref:red chlorophyll catabolite reductase n=1 Tax=Flemingia macrophylla TaxID=520843 RepID=A0ABD1KZF5_9FABA